MKNWLDIITHPRFRYIDHTNKTHFNGEKYTALTSFAIDDALTLSISNRLSPPTMRLWAHDKTIVLGIPDARVPYLEDGVRALAEQGYHVMIRNSGGLAVALDEGVLNLSLLLPDTKHLSIHDGYEAMYHFIKQMLADYTTNIEAYEIVGSYCPGDYDLSINGVKFAGISQRRIRDGAAIQIYLDVTGNSQERASLVRSFYDLGIRGEQTKFTYPAVQPEKMGSLSELIGQPITVDEVKERIFNTLNTLNDEIITPDFSEQEQIDFQKRYKQMLKRNEAIHQYQ